MKFTCSLLTLGALFATSAFAATTLDVDDPLLKVEEAAKESPAQGAIEAFNKGRYIEAVRLATPLAEAGNAEALMLLGVAAESGNGVDLSLKTATEYYRKAHTAGNTEATYRLARLLVEGTEEEERTEARTLLEELSKTDKGRAALLLGEGALSGWFGGEPDFDKARTAWEQAAEQGEVAGYFALGRLLDGNFGFPEKRDAKAALEQFLKAAELDNATAMVAAGSRLLNGDPEVRNEPEGRRWLGKAIDKEELTAYFALGDFEEMVRKDDAKALAVYEKGAEAGQSDCMLKVAAFHQEGRAGLKKDSEKALEWFKKAGEAGNAMGHFQAASALLKGEGLEIVEGYTHLIAAAESGAADVQNELGLFYLAGRLGIRDATAAAGWFGRSASAGFPQAAYNLGALYEQGVGVPRNPGQAGNLYSQAANTGHPQSTTALGRLHALGLGTAQDLPKAWALYSLAIERDDKEAAAPLGDLTSQLSEDQIKEGRRLLEELKSAKPAADKDKPGKEKEEADKDKDKPAGEKEE